MTTKFAHNSHAQLDTKNLNVYINGAQILKDVNVSTPKGQDYLHHRSFRLRQVYAPPYLQPIERPRGRLEDEWRGEPR